MQATLLGLGIALIVALVAALIGPHFVDWTQHRSAFEIHLSRLVGVPVRVSGAIEARLLPTPSVVLREVEAGVAGREATLRTGEASVELALGPLLRGELRATELRLAAPTLALRLDEAGRLEWPGAGPGIEADKLAIERVAIENGRVVVNDAASGSALVLDRFWFNGDMRSLAGPFKGDGGFVSGGERYLARVATGRYGEDGLKLKLNLDLADRQMAIEADGMLRMDSGAPRFEGTLGLGRAAGVALAGGRAVANEAWRFTARVKLVANGGLADQIEAQFGPDERAIKLTGTAQITFGKAARAEGIISARQIDLDRAFVLPEGTRRVPLAVLRRATDAFVGVAALAIPVRLGFAIDSITLAGATLQTVRGDIASAGDGWNLENFELRAPGLTQLRTSARIVATADGPTFTGPLVIESSDSKALLGWLEGRTDPPQPQAGALRASGEVTVGKERIAVERLEAEIDRKAIAGRLAYWWATAPRPARLEAELSAAELDVDQTIASVRAAIAGTTIDAPGEMKLAVDVGTVMVAGVEAKKAHATVSLDSKGLTLQRVAVADLGGAALVLNGRIASALTSPKGTLTLELEAGALDGVGAVLARYAPQTADAVRVASRWVPTKLSVLVTAHDADGGAGSKIELVVSGKAGPARINLTAEATGEPSRLLDADLNVTGRLYADDGAALAAVAGVERAFAVDKRPAVLTMTAGGRASDLRLDARFAAARLEGSIGGTLRVAAETGVTSEFDVKLAAADALLLRSEVGAPVPVTLNTRLVVKNSGASLQNLSAVVAGAGVRGHLDVAFAKPLRLEGRLETDALDLVSAARAAAGLPAGSAGGNDKAGWPTEALTLKAWPGVVGQIALEAQRVTISSTLAAENLRGHVRFAEGELSFEDIEARLGGGRFLGQLMLRAGGEGTLRLRLALTDAGASMIIPGAGRAPLTGRFGLQLEAEGSGLSPATLVGSLRGAGTVTLQDARLDGLDPKAFDAVIGAVDRGLTIDAAKIRDMMEAALRSGQLSVARADGAFTITAGQARWGNAVVRGEGADLSISGVIDLPEWVMDARLILSASGRAPTLSVGHPDVFMTLKGPVATPRRTLDVSAFTGWLTLRSIERQSKQLEKLQSERQHEATVSTIPVPPGPAAPRAPSSPERAPEEGQAGAPPPPPRRALAPTAPESAPALPPPIEIRPLPGPRSAPDGVPRTPEAAPSKRRPNSAASPPADFAPAEVRRSILDRLFGPQH